ncbi:MAG: hypothetical protein HC866_06770 [Leptolyngbyaceae cyanobacterium RU_5_1]|nr:hypothetical protein [Leptolyngbyaceae cyanobacterium RU_5_1]
MSQSSAVQQTTPATSLEDVYKTLQPEPLETPEELAAFYQAAINQVRGGDKIERIRLRLGRAYRDGIPFKACVMGHRGVGKSTELSRLIERINNQFRVIRFSAMTVLDPGSFRPLDVLLLMMAEVAERTALLVQQGGAGKRPSEARLREIWDWFATEKDTREQAQTMAATVEAGVGAKEESLWSKIVGLFATLKGEIKFAATRKQEVVEYRVSRLTSLIEVANRLLDECNQALRTASGHQWLFIGEDFDRAGIPNQRIEDLFVTYANIFQDLRTHLIFTLPIGLYYSSSAPRLPFPGDCSFVIPDTPMYQPDHTANAIGREAVQKVLAARMNLDLFEPEQMMRLIVASGGNLRDLFSLVNYAADSALLRSATQINAEDVQGAIVNLRSDYERRLGLSPFDRETVTYDDKAALLERIYNGEKEAQITDPVYSLLNSRAVQEFNGQRWFGVHPLVVDILVGQGRLSQLKAGVVPDGTL